METKQYLIKESDYLAHIDRQIRMYDLLLTLAQETRNLLLDGKFAAVMRVLNEYEYKADREFLDWGIPDDYLCGSNPKDLSNLMEAELLDVVNDGCSAEDRFLRPCCLTCGVNRPDAGQPEGSCGA